MTDQPQPVADEHSFAQALREETAQACQCAAEIARLLGRHLARQQVNGIAPRVLAEMLHDAGVARRHMEAVRDGILQELGLDLDHEDDVLAGL